MYKTARLHDSLLLHFLARYPATKASHGETRSTFGHRPWIQECSCRDFILGRSAIVLGRYMPAGFVRYLLVTWELRTLRARSHHVLSANLGDGHCTPD